MSDEIKRDRSPKYPKLPLSKALEMANVLYKKAGKARMAPQAAVGAWGYSGLNGAALTMLGTLTAYGLLSREGKSGLSVSPLTIALLHPTNGLLLKQHKAESALFPGVFRELHADGFRDSDESVICNHLIQKGFTPDGAALAASVYIENFKFAELDYFRSNADMKREKGLPIHADILAQERAIIRGEYKQVPTPYGSSSTPFDYNQAAGPLAAYSFPIGANKVTITIEGETLSVEDFDDLGQQIVFFKKQFERKQKSEGEKKRDSCPGRSQ